MDDQTTGEVPPEEPAPPPGAGREDAGDLDPVIHEIPVFLSKATPLYLFQYPVRPASMPYTTTSVSAARLRPRARQVELELALDTRSENYDPSRGEQIKLNVDGSESAGLPGRGGGGAEPGYFSGPRMDKQVLGGSAAVASSSRYAVGILNDNELHLTPVAGVLALKPSLAYLDRGDKTAKREGRLPGQQQEEEDEEDNKPQAVTVKFAKGDLEKDKARKEKTYSYQQAKQDEEPWLQMKFNQVKSQRWEEESQAMFCNHMDEDIKNLELEPHTYLQTLKEGEG